MALQILPNENGTTARGLLIENALVSTKGVVPGWSAIRNV
jgi:hypothetical protein